ncbi:hypothetical protein GIB67_002696 [Kingdonia uniflora]|uniref:CCHC-type domain-containing protein n=1 Tax=Kingdonia uniflora TaxID=39325 RepID=A0A7J7LJW4_9MAGN|nr:hypothetical protein GIB67_002696 [Kingdonia uniflora]
MGIVQTSLCHGPVYFDVYPNLTLFFTDKSLFDAISLRIQTQGYDFIPGAEVIAVIYKIHYKVMNTLCPRAILKSEPGKTIAVQSNCLTTNIAVNRLINWNEINIPTEWVLPQAVVPRPRFNNQVSQITQTVDGDVEVSFASHPIRLSLHKSKSCRQLTHEEEIPYHVSCPSTRPSVSRHSTSEPIIKGIRLSDQQIPHGVYHHDPNTSTRSEFIWDEFSTARNDSFRRWYHQNFTEEKLGLIEDIYYHEIERCQKIIFFYDWFITWYSCPQYIISNMEDFTKTWVKADGIEIQFVHPPPESLHLIKGHNNSKPLEANAFAYPTNPQTDVNLIVKQKNWTNVTLQTTGNQLNRIEDHIQRPSPSTIDIDEASTSSSILHADIKPICEMSYNRRTIYEWNIDGLSEYQIYEMIHKMLMYACICKTAGNEDDSVAKFIANGFTGAIKGWWDNVITENQKMEIFGAVKRKGTSTNPVKDVVYTLVQTILLHFVGLSPQKHERNRELLQNLRCPSLTHFKWYKDVYISKAMQCIDANAEHWKARFIEDFPHCSVLKFVRNLKTTSLKQQTTISPSEKTSLQKYKDHEEPYYHRHRKRKRHLPYATSSRPTETRTCYKCGKKGYLANKYSTKRKLQELQLDEGLKLQLSKLLLNTTSEEDSSDNTEAINYIDHSVSSSTEATPCVKCSGNNPPDY